jgi:hypothetical protein
MSMEWEGGHVTFATFRRTAQQKSAAKFAALREMAGYFESRPSADQNTEARTGDGGGLPGHGAREALALDGGGDV